MANESAKKIVKKNTQVLQKAVLFALGFFALHILGLWFTGSSSGHWWASIVFLLLNFATLGFFKFSSTPKYGADGSLVSAGTDLSQRGIIDFGWDVIYMTWICQVLTLISAWFWLLMLFLPIYGVYKVVSFTKSMGQYGQQQQPQEADKPTKRSRSVKEAPQVKYVRG